MKQVNQYDLNNNFIKTHESVESALRDIGVICGGSTIRAVCNRKTNTAYGYVWKWEEDDVTRLKDGTRKSTESV